MKNRLNKIETKMNKIQKDSDLVLIIDISEDANTWDAPGGPYHRRPEEDYKTFQDRVKKSAGRVKPFGIPLIMQAGD